MLSVLFSFLNYGASERGNEDVPELLHAQVFAHHIIGSLRPKKKCSLDFGLLICPLRTFGIHAGAEQKPKKK